MLALCPSLILLVCPRFPRRLAALRVPPSLIPAVRARWLVFVIPMSAAASCFLSIALFLPQGSEIWANILICLNITDGCNRPSLKQKIMATFWKITREDQHARTQYLCGVQPTRWSLEDDQAQRFNYDDAVHACRWLLLIGVSFTVRQFSTP